MLAEAITGEASEPWSVKERPWAVYDSFDTADGTKLFFAVVGDGQWKDFCVEFGRSEWLSDPRLATNTDRSAARPWLIPMIAALIAERSADELSAIFERLGLPFAPIRSPDELADDPHLNQSGGLVEVTLPNGATAKAPTLPITLDGRRLCFQSDPPQVGADTRSVLQGIGVDGAAIEQLITDGVAACVVPETRTRAGAAELTT
jgi:crotonobetainyl-CoA:carnitine CoA-transferase CaiB-like acyl-CoA transferase